MTSPDRRWSSRDQAGQPSPAEQRTAERQATEDAELVRLVLGYWREHGYGPSMRDVAAGLGMKLSATQRRIQRARDRGLVVYADGLNRTLCTSGLAVAIQDLASALLARAVAAELERNRGS
jgi:hypothetical protein